MIAAVTEELAARIEEGIRLAREGRSSEAIVCLASVVEEFPDSADAHFNLGVACREAGDAERALVEFEAAAACAPSWAEAHYNLANTLRDNGQREGAMRSFHRALECRPNYVKALNNLANLYSDQGELPQAEQLLRRALAAKSDYSEGMFNLARIYRRQRRMREAIELTASAARLQPNNAKYQLKLAELTRIGGDPAAAQTALEKLLEAQPGHVEATLQLVTILRERNKLDDALQLLDLAIARAANVDLLWQRADLRRMRNQFDDALADLHQALELDPRSAPVHNLIGVVLFARGDSEASLPHYEEALRLRADFPEAHNNYGAALQSLKRVAESRAAFATALRLKPDFNIAHLNQALSYLKAGDYAAGWQEFEWRLMCQDYRLGAYNKPLWTGERLDGKTILLRFEQGLGDTFQFIRFAPLVKARGGRVIFECQAAARHLAATCPGVDQVVVRGEPYPHVDVQIPLMSLPSVLGTTLDTVPCDVPYLQAKPEIAEKWRDRIRALGKVVVGIAWQGNRKYQADHLRSLPLSYFVPLASIEGVALVSLQKNDGADQLEQHREAIHQFTDELDLTEPFADTAAIIDCLDLVITCDTAIGHLAGAMGKPVWTVLTYSSDWRWLDAKETSAWYPNTRLFRQQSYLDWSGVFERVTAELSLVAAGERERRRALSRRRSPSANSPINSPFLT